jgi:hypothetical protein
MEIATTSGQDILLPESSRKHRRERKVTIEVNSQDRSRTQSYNSNNFRWDFRRPLKDVVAIELVSGSIPADLYNVTPDWNKFVFGETGSANVVVTLTPGQYMATEIAIELQTQLNAIPGKVNTYTVTYSATTKRLTITGSTATPFTFFFQTGLPYVDTIHRRSGVVENILCPAKLLGFDFYDYTSIVVSVTTVFSPPNRVDMDYCIKRVYLYVNTDSSKELTRIEMGAGRHDCFHIIYLPNIRVGFHNLNRELYTPIYYSAPAPISRMSSLIISIRDEFYRLIDLGGHEFNLIFEFTVLD